MSSDLEMASTVSANAPHVLSEAIDALLQEVLKEIDDRSFTADDFVVMVQRVTELVSAAHGDVSPLQQKRIVMSILQRIADFVLPKVQDENVRAAIQVALSLSGSFYDVLRAQFLAKFDVNKDGSVSPEEFNAVCADCCMCVPKSRP